MNTWKDVGSRWASEVGAALGFTDDTPVIGLSEEVDYQGSCYFVARPSKNKIVVYGWSYGSCSGCDSWEDNEGDIEPEVKAAAKTMTVKQFRKYAEGVINAADKYDWTPSNHAAVVMAIEELDKEEAKA